MKTKKDELRQKNRKRNKLPPKAEKTKSENWDIEMELFGEKKTKVNIWLNTFRWDCQCQAHWKESSSSQEWDIKKTMAQTLVTNFLKNLPNNSWKAIRVS